MSIEPRPQGCTNLKLRQLTRCLGQHYDAYLAESGLKITQYSLLSAVCKLGPLQPVELARYLRMGASTLTRNLKPLVDAGWVELLPGPDARSRQVVATATGKRLRAKAQLRWRAAQEAINARLGNARVNALHALLDEALQRMDEVNDVELSDV